MVLAVDIGNTNIVMGCFESDRILFVERLSTNQQSTALEYAIMLKNILEIHSIDMSDFRGGIISVRCAFCYAYYERGYGEAHQKAHHGGRTRNKDGA